MIKKTAIALLAFAAAGAYGAAEDEAVAIVKNWTGDGYYMDIGRAVEGLLLGFEAQGKSIQRVGWYATVTGTGHVDVRYNFLIDGANAEAIFLFDQDEGRVSPANDWARAAVTLATTVAAGGTPKAPKKPANETGGVRGPEDVQAEIATKQRKLEEIYENYLNRYPHAGGKLKVKFTITAAGGVTAVEVVESTINIPALQVSLVRAISAWTFSPATNDIIITYPFVFYNKK